MPDGAFFQDARGGHLQSLAIPRQLNRFAAPLSPRQAEILELLSRGRARKKIADAVSLSENTVKKHIKRLLQKSCCASTRDMIFAGYIRPQALAAPTAAPPGR